MCVFGRYYNFYTETLCTTSLSLTYSTAEYCSSVWLNSPQVGKVDVVLSQTIRIISAAITIIPLYSLPILSSIEPLDHIYYMDTAIAFKNSDVVVLTCTTCFFEPISFFSISITNSTILVVPSKIAQAYQ